VKKFTLLVTLLICCFIADQVFGEDVKRDYARPLLLSYIQVPRYNKTNFAQIYTCIGDVNGDGCDDLLASHSPTYEPSPEMPNRVELYYGGAVMDNVPKLFISAPKGEGMIGSYLQNLGKLVPHSSPFLGLRHNIQLTPPPNVTYEIFNWILNTDSLPDGQPEYVFQGRTKTKYQYFPVPSHHSNPFDFNGDGNPDILMIEPTYYSNDSDSNEAKIMVYYGGDAFNTSAGWSTVLSCRSSKSVDAAIGSDLNGDGYDDIILRFSREEGLVPFYRLYLGGVNPPKSPYWELKSADFPDEEIDAGLFAMLQDVNGDGYDEWGFYYFNRDRDIDGFHVFLGSENPDPIPDIQLSGTPTGASNGDLCGGDFNGDGYGDIVTGNPEGWHNAGEVCLHFGRPGWEPTKKPAIRFRGYEEMGGMAWMYLGHFIGAVGDYNGDNVEDFVVSVSGRLAVFAGSRDWRVDVGEVAVPRALELSLKAYPNPFNSTVTLNYQLPLGSEGEISIFTTEGRRLFTRKITKNSQETGTLEWSPDGLPTGLYIAVIECEHNNQTERKAVRLVNLK